MTLTTSGGSACMSSKGVSKILESTFIITTSSRPFSRTLCDEGREGGPPLRVRGSLAGEGTWGCRGKGDSARPRNPVPLSPRRDWRELR